MPVTLLADGAVGKIGIWTGNDDLPFASPRDHLSRVKFHSDLAYPKVIDERVIPVTFERRSRFNGTIWVANDAEVKQSYLLFAHGRPGFPWVLGSVDINGVKVAMTGSIPIQQGLVHTNGNSPSPWVRWVSLGADATNVYLYEYTVLDRNASSGYTDTNMAAVTRTFTIWVTDKLL